LDAAWDYLVTLLYWLFVALPCFGALVAEVIILNFDNITIDLLSFVHILLHTLDIGNIVTLLATAFIGGCCCYLVQFNGIRKKFNVLYIFFLLVAMNQPPTGSGTVPLQEYRRDIPPGWMPGNPQYPLREYLEKLRLWYRIAGVEDEMIGPLIAGRLYGRASKLAMALRVPRPDGAMDVGDAALVRLAVDEVHDPATGQVLQHYIPSGVQFLINALRQAFGQQDQDLATQALDKFFGLSRGKMSLAEYSVEFEARFDEAHDRAGLVMNDVAKFYLFFKNSGLSNKTVDDIKLQVQGDYARFQDARQLALRLPRIAQNMMEVMSSMEKPMSKTMRRRCSLTGMMAGTTMAKTGIGATMQTTATKVTGTTSLRRSTTMSLASGTTMMNGGRMMESNMEFNNPRNKMRPLPILIQHRRNSLRRSTTVAKEKESIMMDASDVAANGIWRGIAL
jgi:hypothetical protein